MSAALEVIGPRNGAAPLEYELAEIGVIDLQSVYAHFDGTNAAGPFRPALTIRSQSGAILARVFPGDQLTVGDEADVTFAPMLATSTTGASSSVTRYSAVVDVSSSGDHTIVAAVGGLAIRVVSIVLVSAGSPVVQWYSDSSSGAAVTGPIDLANTPGYAPGDGIYGQTVAGQKLVLNCSTADAVGGVIGYELV